MQCFRVALSDSLACVELYLDSNQLGIDFKIAEVSDDTPKVYRFEINKILSSGKMNDYVEVYQSRISIIM